MTETEQELSRRLTCAAQAVEPPDRWEEVVADAEQSSGSTVTPLWRHRTFLAVAAVAASIIVGVVLIQRSDDPTTVTTDVADERQPPSTPSTVPPSTEPTTSTTTSTTTTTTTPVPPLPVDPTLPPFPPASTNLVHGGDIWAVVLAAGPDNEAPEVMKAVADADAAGYRAGPTDCDQGAPEALGVDGNLIGVYSVSIYFDREADARAAVEAFEARSVPTVAAVVQTFCLD